jgi:hypothetical protein
LEKTVHRELVGGAANLKVQVVQSPNDVHVVLEGHLPESLDLNDIRKLRMVLAEAERRMLVHYDNRLKANNGVLF